MRRTLFICLLFLLAVPLGMSAQGISAWETVLYYETIQPGGRSGELVVLTPNGVTATYGIPAGLYAPAEASARADVAISSDRRYAALAFWTGGATQPLPPIVVLDLQTGASATVAPPVADMDGYALAGFSPNGVQLAASYIGFTDRATYTTAGGLMVIDSASGMPVASLTAAQVAASMPDMEGIAYLQPGDWTTDGIAFIPTCYGCGGTIQSAWFVWNPQTNTVLQAANAYYSIFGDRLEATNELLLNAYNTAYPTGESMGMFPPTNVVEYYGQGVPPSPDQAEAFQASAPVVYFNPANLDLSPARWILDGNAFLIQANEGSPQSIVVYRNGEQEALALAATDRFLTGTPDGFLAQRPDGWVTYYQHTGSAWNIIDLDLFPAQVSVIDAPSMGSAITQPFTLLNTSGAQAGVEQPGLAPQQQPAGSCPGLVASRLSPGGLGRVVPGGFPNRLRADATTGAQILTLMQPGTTFNVLSGPVCDGANGIVWWQVDASGLVGWSAESQNGSYFLEPAG